MPEIGKTLRETRMRRRIDISEVEAATKIRAKYLRALENEEWDLLPGPTYVKTFLRTYAEYLDLDPRLYVEEYRQRYERPSDRELTPFGPGLGGQRRRRRPRPAIGPGLVVGAIILLLIGALYLLGTWGQDNGEQAQTAPTPTPAARRTATPTPTATPRRRHRVVPTRARVRLTATAAVYVCMVDAGGRAVVDRVILQPGQSTHTFRSRRFRANFGNGGIRMRVNGHTYRAATSSDPIGYEIRPTGRPRQLPDAVRSRLCA